MARLSLEPIGHPLSGVLDERELRRNRDWMAPLEERLEQARATVREGWGARPRARLADEGKLDSWSRIEALKDPDSPLLPIGSFVNWERRFEGSRRPAPGAGVITGFARVHQRWVVVIANDNLVASGAWWPGTPEKIQRAQRIALRLELPVVYLVECSGLFLPQQSGSFAGGSGAGHIFKLNALLSDAGVPQIAGVFGACIAGGGYMPIISDRVIMTEQAYMVIAGAALIKGAKSQNLTSTDLGGPEIHVHRSGCADARVPDDATCLEAIRSEIELLPTSAAPFYRQGNPGLPPHHEPSELSGLFPPDHRETYDAREVLARLLDGSLFHEFLPAVGQEVITGIGRIGGLWAGLVINDVGTHPHPRDPGGTRAGGILYREGVAKLATFSRHCDANGLPLIWLQDVAGFDIGLEAEQQGLLGYGSSLIYSNSTNTTPMFTVLLRRASGAGYYAQAGLPFDPVIQLSTPMTRLAVMEGRTLAIATYNKALDDDFEIITDNPEERRLLETGMEETAGRIERDMDPWAAAARGDTDEIVPLHELRTWLEAMVEVSYQATGNRRVRNPRIWTFHDMEALCSGSWSETT
jgi:3-methylcrotonyl-CoA carboxylase beta subunit